MGGHRGGLASHMSERNISRNGRPEPAFPLYTPEEYTAMHLAYPGPLQGEPGFAFRQMSWTEIDRSDQDRTVILEVPAYYFFGRYSLDFLTVLLKNAFQVGPVEGVGRSREL